MGAKFADGALAGLASGLAEAASANMLGGINDAVSKGTMTATEAVAARAFARVIGSAIRAAASPGDPGQAFASAFLDDVFKQIDTTAPVTQTAFDDEGRLNLGIVDPNASPEQQAQQLAAQLQRQGIPLAQANLMAQQALGNVVNGVAQLPGPVNVVATPAVLLSSDPFATISSEDEVSYADLLADQLGVPRENLVGVGLRDYAGRSFDVLSGFAEGSGFSILDTGNALWEIAKSPSQFINGVKLLLNSAEARAQFGDEMVARVKVDVQMLEDAFNSGDMRGTGQQLGKLVVDFAQLATGVEGLVRLGIGTTSMGGRLLLGAADYIASARAFAAEVGRIPLGFEDARTFLKFGDELYTGLKSAGVIDAQAGFQGSAVTGFRFRPPNEPFDLGRLSDFDVAIASPSLLQRAKELGIGVRSQGSRTGPLFPNEISMLGLAELQTSLSASAGRPVKFMLFESFDTVAIKAPTIPVPKKP
jgi:hypothetical protein